MIFRSLGCAFLMGGLASLTACSGTPASTAPPAPAAGNGGNSNPGAGSGGAPASGGGPASGGASTAGGAGAPSGGAAPAAGGATPGGAPATGGSGTAEYVIPTVTWPSAECTTKANDLLAQMSVAEKAAQMVMGMNPANATVTSVEPGVVFSGADQGPAGGYAASAWAALVDGYIAAAAASKLKLPLLYGIDAVHGASRTVGAVLFPHNAGLGSTRDPALVEEIGHATAVEAAAQGMSWTYAPSLSVSFDDHWGRVYESFSEDPDLTGLLGAAVTVGLQGRGGLGTGNPGIVACGKHFAADGQATAGTSSKGGVVDRGNVQVDEATLRKYGIAPYLPAIKAGIGTIMVSDARWMDANMTSHTQLITTILKGELGFKGAVVTDWEAAGEAGGVVATVKAGVDMLMQPNDWQTVAQTIAAAAGGMIPNDRIDDAVRRILTVKCQAGMFGKLRDAALMSQIGSAEHRALGRRAVGESLVLLQNEKSALPLKKGGKFWVVGSGSDSLDHQCGGWSVGWQGGGNGTQGTTIKAAIAKLGSVVATAAEADAAVVVLSEGPYAEFKGDSATIDTLPAADFSLLQQARASGKPVVAIVIAGRPVLITAHLTDADAWIAAWLPGTEGDGVADVLFGDHKPSGKLSHSWPKTEMQANSNFGQPGYDPLFMLGFGLSY
jgi:beta-glucosidase